MKILFTKSETPGSRLIQWITGEAMSHVAVELSSGIIIHSTGNGVVLTWHSTFKKDHTIVTEATYVGFQIEPFELIEKLMNSEKSGYDWLLFIALGLRRLSIPVPVWNTPTHFICTEMVSEFVIGDNTKYTPGELFDTLETSPVWQTKRN